MADVNVMYGTIDGDSPGTDWHPQYSTTSLQPWSTKPVTRGGGSWCRSTPFVSSSIYTETSGPWPSVSEHVLPSAVPVKHLLISLAVNWLMFFVFSLLRCTNRRRDTEGKREDPRALGSGGDVSLAGFLPQYAHVLESIPSGVPGFRRNGRRFSDSGDAAVATATTPPTTSAVAVVRRLAGREALFHDCGTHRPPAFFAKSWDYRDSFRPVCDLRRRG